MPDKPASNAPDYPIGHRQYEAGLGTPQQRVNFALQALASTFHFSEMAEEAHLEPEGMPNKFDTLARLRWIAEHNEARQAASASPYWNKVENIMVTEATVVLKLLYLIEHAGL